MQHVTLALLLPLIFGSCATRLTDAEKEKLATAANESRKTGVCNIHHVHMEKELVRVEYADLPLEYYSSAYSEARLCEFPNSREYALSLQRSDEGRNVHVYVCPYCKRAERDWIQRHPTDEWGKTLGPKSQ
jgi:hypothetical protein